MTMALFFDTETSGLPNWKEPSSDPNQPHIVQLAAALVDVDTQKTVSSMDVIITPAAWTIPEEIEAIHGISTAVAIACGVEEVKAVALFMDLWARCDFRVAHNERFDARIIRIALMRYLPPCRVHDEWKNGTAECTQRLATPIVGAPPTEKMLAANRTHHKTATLAESYRHFFGVEMEGAHTAMADVIACQRVFFALKGVGNGTTI